MNNFEYLQKYIKTHFDENYYQTHEIFESNPRLLKLIQLDIERGLWRLNILFEIRDKKKCIFLQKLFFKYFLQIWQTFPTETQELYFQGVTDIFELFFAAFIDKRCLNEIITHIQPEEYEYFEIESIVLNKRDAVEYGI